MNDSFSLTPKAALLLCSVAALMAVNPPALHGQSALDGFDPNANFHVRVVVAQPDGKILIGGDFTSFSPNGGAAVPRNRMARLNPDGSLDSFNPNVDGAVNTVVSVIVVQPDGKILIGGDFTTLAPNGGATVTRNRIARLNPDGSLDTAFNPNANAVVSAIAVQADGRILVGGTFNGANSIGGQTRNRIARLDATNGLADSFNPDASGFGIFVPAVSTIEVQTDGRILVGGRFASIGGQSRSHIARLDPTTGVADFFNPNASAGLGSSVNKIAVQADGKILVGGGFSTIGGQARANIARLDPVTGAADSWNPNANNAVNAVVVQPDGKVLVSGDFTVVGGVTNFMARLDPVTGVPEAGFDRGLNERVASIAVQPDGKILIGGFFTSLGAQTRNRIARLERDGRLDRTLDLRLSVNPGGLVLATAVQPDGKILIGGAFTGVLGAARNNIARLNTDGTLDFAFSPNANNVVRSIVVQADGKIIACGDFTVIGGTGRNYIARLDPTTGLADSFNPNASSQVFTIAAQPDGKILVGGVFTAVSGQPRNRIARLNSDGSLDTIFYPHANSFVYSVVVQADGKILVGGGFNGTNSIGGQARNYLARLDPTTGLADSFNPNPNSVVNTIAVQEDGEIIVGGNFTVIGGTNRNYIARLDATTGLADSFNPNASSQVFTIAAQTDGKILAGGNFNGIGGQPRSGIARLNTDGSADSFTQNVNFAVCAIAGQADGKILVGGQFTQIGGQARNLFARLNNDTAALQNLAATQTTVTWTRGGSSPQLARVTFEYSTNNVNYTPLGHGTAAGSNWTLSGLNLVTGQNLYIRARGFYRGGYFNGSESITESVRNVFLPPPQPRLSIQRGANTNIVLSWATNFPDLTLESRTNLNTNVWSTVSPAPSVSGTNHVVTNAISGSNRFYRLRQ